MKTKPPIFIFRIDNQFDRVILTAKHRGVTQNFEIDGMKFDIAPVKTIPEEFAGYEDVYEASIATFNSVRANFEGT